MNWNLLSWGKLISTTGSLASTVGAKNPYRYRGYRYDAETGLYYLQSRYYNPEFCRMLNADAVGGIKGKLLSHNVFAYSLNNPVNRHDPSGYWSLKTKIQELYLLYCIKIYMNAKSTQNAIINTIKKGVSKVSGKFGGKVAQATSKADFYVKPNGDAIPSTGYRYMDSKYAEQTFKTNSAPGSYFGFDKFETASEARNALQISSEWSNARLRGEFDTLQIIDDIRIPFENGDVGPLLEPFTSSYPEFGIGGYRQVITKSIIFFKKNGLKMLGE